MDIRRNSWHAKAFSSFYPNSSLPKSLCNYFWATLIAVLLYIPAYPTLIINRYYHTNIPGGVGVAFTILGTMCGYLISNLLPTTNLFVIHIVGMLSITIITGLILGLIYLSIVVTDMITLTKYKLSKKTDSNIVIAQVKSIKNKYCPHINWK